MRLLERMLANAQQLTQSYGHANQILNTAVNDAMTWGMPLVMQGVVPPVDRIERLTTQLLAILMATYPDEFVKPIRGYVPVEARDG